MNWKLFVEDCKTYIQLATIFNTPLVWRKKNIWKIMVITPQFFKCRIKKIIGEE